MGGRITLKSCCLLLSLCLLLTGCGQGGTVVEDYTYTDSATPWEEQEEREEPVSQGLTSFALAYHQGQSLDPITCGEGAQLQLAALLYEPLFQMDGTFQPRPLLCEAYEADPDHLTYTLTIRQGVTFSDGSTLGAADVAATLRRAMASERYGNRLRHVRQVTVSGGRVVISLNTPNSELPALLDIPIIKAGSEKNEAPVGTGPYLYITAGDGAYLTANPDWWQEKDLPLERIELVNAKDSDTVVYLFTSREIQVYATDLTGGSTALTGSLTTVDAPTATMQFIGVNAGRTALRDGALRQALCMGVPRETVVEGYLSGHGEPAQFPVSPVAEDYPQQLEQAYSYELYRKAAAALGERQLTLLVNGDSAVKTAIAQYLAESLSVEGLTVTVRALPWAEYLRALAAGDFDLYYGEVRLTADWDVSELIGTGGALNYGGWSDETTDTLLAAYHARGRGSDRLALYQHLQEAVPVIPVCFKNHSLLVHSGTVEGVQPTAANVFYNFPEWTVRMASSEE